MQNIIKINEIIAKIIENKLDINIFAPIALIQIEVQVIITQYNEHPMIASGKIQSINLK